MRKYARGGTCLRNYILSYFAQAGVATQDGCGTCSVCGWVEPRPNSVYAARPGRYPRSSFGGPGGRGCGGEYEGGYGLALDGSLDADGELFDRLRQKRKEIADDMGFAPYMVFGDRTLREMAERRPRDEDELLEIYGVGLKKPQRYGRDFLDVLRSA